MRDLAELLYAKCSKLGKHSYHNSSCWEWIPKPQPNGYCNFTYRQGRLTITTQAHRLSYELAYNTDLPNSIQVDHKCQNRICINPAHLEAVTPLENTRRIRYRED